MIKKLLNIGCGNTYHLDWENIDIRPCSPHVKSFDIRKRLPYPDEFFDAVYSSHLLEHLAPDQTKPLLKEIKRVLKKNGTARIVVPDLEVIVRIYLEKLEAAANNIPGAENDYNWIILELIDQMARSFPGGEMVKFLGKKDLKNRDFIRRRIGKEAEQLWEVEIPDTSTKHIKKKNVKEALGKKLVKLFCGKEALSAFEEGLFRNSGEVHRWMYDRFSLKRLLDFAGFKAVTLCRADESSIYDFNSYGLDIREGKIRKPDSLFMEARK